MIWVPYTHTNGQWIATKLLQGFFGAPIESLCEISVADVVSLCAETTSGSTFLTNLAFHSQQGLLPSSVCILLGRKQLLCANTGRVHQRRPRMEVGVGKISPSPSILGLTIVVLVCHPLRYYFCSPVLLDGGDQLLPETAYNRK